MSGDVAAGGRPDASGGRDAFARLDALARVAQAAVGPDAEGDAGDRDAWRPGAHGDAPTPKPALGGEGLRYSLSRLRRATPGADAVSRDADRAAEALAEAGCATRVDAFADGARWVRAEHGGSVIVVKLLPNGNRLVTAQSPDLPGDPTRPEA